MFNFAVKLELDKPTGAYVVSCRDLPFLNSVGYSIEEALIQARFAVITTLSIEIDERRPIPEPTPPQADEYVVFIPVLAELKATLHNAMIETGTRKSDLARLLNAKAPIVDRLIDIEHSSKIEAIENALSVLGRGIEVNIIINNPNFRVSSK